MTVADPHRRYEIRCPVHGFIEINDWEREILAHPAVQRLRRIRQLAWTDQVYPGAMHTRFEHSLGVMHIATQLYDAIAWRSRDLLVSELGYTDIGLQRDKTLVRLTALLHDVGHSPFSHASEEVFPFQSDGQKRYKHEAYSAAIIRRELKSVIEDHPLNRNVGFTVEDITALLEGSLSAGHRILWRELIDGQFDADRMDYLLRDSLHAGVEYGRYDWRRLLNTAEVVPVPEGPGQHQVAAGRQ
jgi:HD superfamily phosphohydrolase